MKRLLEETFYPYVIKPGRYAGGEPGSIARDHADRVKYLLAFPDKYEIGHSYLGLQTLYHIVNQDDRFVGERVFAPDHDAEALLRRAGIPLFSLESRTAAADFDAIGFTLSYELVFTTVLQMLDLAGIPLRSADRTDAHPLIFAGGPAAYNPEPMAPFVDLFYIGDGEEGLPQMLGILHELRGATRREKLERLVREVESVYVPSFYDDHHKPVVDFAPAEIVARVIPQLKPEYYPERPIVPLIETVHQHLSIEIMRGCPRGCRFCEAGAIYKPVRLRPQADILNQVEIQEQWVGADTVSLLSLSTSDYPEIDDLARKVARRLEPMKAAISVPSLRPGSITPELLDTLKMVRKAGLTIAPEAGTERLRAFIRKDIPDAAVYDSAEIAFAKGVTTLKLYFMIGLPTETEEDLLAICDMVRRVFDISQNYPGKRTVNVTLSPFVAEPHTAFQWDATATPQEIHDKLQFIKRNVRSRHINFKHNSSDESVLKALLSRGGREMGPVIEDVYRAGGRFDGWSEDFNPRRWFDTCRAHGIDIEDRLKPVPFSAELPWSHIRKGSSVEHLQKERHRTSTMLREYVPKFRGDVEVEEPAEPEMQFGRSKKKVASRNLAAPTKNRVRLRWGKTERYKYMSHLDNLRLLERTIRRSRIPVAYSQGFHPTMKLSFGPPLPLGFTSEAEYLDITFESNFMPYMLDKLRAALPEGIDLFDAAIVLDKAPSLSSVLNRVEYLLPLDEGEDTAALTAKAGEALAGDRLEIERIGKNGATTIDIRPALYSITVTDKLIELTLGVGEGGYARPDEVLGLLFPAERVKPMTNRLHRRAMYRVDSLGARIDPMRL